MNGMERKIVYLYNKYLFMLAEKHINGTIAIGLMWDGVEINGLYDVLNGFVVCLVLSCRACDDCADDEDDADVVDGVRRPELSPDH